MSTASAPTSRREQKEETRRALIHATARLFARDGIAATPTADIAKSCALSHGTVFIHFPSREELILAVLEDFGARLGERFAAAAGPDAGLRELLRAHLATLAEHEDLYRRFVTEVHVLPAKARSLFFMINNNVSWRMGEAIQALPKSARARGTSRHLIFNTWLGLVHHYLAHRDLLGERRPILNEVGDELVRHFLNLIK